MLPLYLSIEGLYSYQNKQEIDFTKLTEAGLFGIFGNVGSGKSSILEAISYALYGETERLNSKEKRLYNMLNLKSNQAFIDFEFLNFENRKFRFTVQWKRRKKFEDTTSIERLAYEWINDHWVPLESNDGALVTSLSYPNFRRTIIIPQGQFKEFLELKGKERSDMMKEIFFLNQYDLGPKVGYLQAENNKKLENIKGALTGFEEVSEEIKVQKALELEKAKQELAALKVDFDAWEKQYKSLAIAKENRQNLRQKEQEWHNLQAKRSKIEQYENEVIEYESVSLNFKEHINNLHQTTALKEQLLRKIEKLQEYKNTSSTEIETTTNQLLALQADFDQLDVFKKQISEYDLLMKNFELNEQKNLLTKRYENGIPFLEEEKTKEKTLALQLQQTEEEVEKLKNKRVNTTDLLAIERWFLTLDEIIRKEQDAQKRLSNNQHEIQALNEKFSAYNVDNNNWQSYIQQQQEKLQQEQNDIRERESGLRLKQELSKYILTLHDGQPCPLCGSADHPNIMHTNDLTQEFDELNQTKENWLKKDSNLRVTQHELSTASQYIIDKCAQETLLLAELNEIAIEKDKHDVHFEWSDFDKSDRNSFEQQKSIVQELENTIKNKELEINSLRKNIDETKTKIINYEQKLSDIKTQIQILEANILQNISQIKNLTDIAYSHMNKMELTNHLNQLDEKIKHVEQRYKELTILLQDSKSKFATVAGQLNEAQEQYKSYTVQLQTLQSTINALLLKFNFADITQVKSILHKTIDTHTLKTMIQQFYQSLSNVTERMKELQEATKDDNYSDDLFAETISLIEQKQSELEKQISITGALEIELHRIAIELDKKTSLVSEFDKLNNRKENLKTLDNMFKGNGFVNYVSSIHLQRLCEIANNRFHRLTKNQLSLCINESNEFEVKDYLNNGYNRSIKTLSGGQSFQASLCLALALAENIQALNKADRNFFFIDEGFGTQDTESINTVFDTLQYLHQENRVVGIISHVEELKERMPRSISVTKDYERGSQVKFN